MSSSPIFITPSDRDLAYWSGIVRPPVESYTEKGWPCWVCHSEILGEELIRTHWFCSDACRALAILRWRGVSVPF